MSSVRDTPPLPFATPGSPPRPGSDAAQYGPEYYLNRFDPPYAREHAHWLQFFGRIAQDIVQYLNPRTVLDVGCAKGFLVECLRDRGVEAYGFDVSQHAIDAVRDDIKPYCWVGSATDGIPDHYDLITCIDVCEHLTEFDARRAIRNMAAHADAILFSSTPADRSEPTHVNVRPIIYWLRAFREFSFTPDLDFNAGIIAPQAILLRHSPDRVSDELLHKIAAGKTHAITESERGGAELQLGSELGQSRTELQSLRAERDQLSRELSEAHAQLASQKERSSYLQAELAERQDELAARTATLKAILSSRGWKLLNKFRDLRTWAMQNEIVRRLGYLVLRRMIGANTADMEYQRWIEARERPSINVPEILQNIARFQYKPKFSILMPVYNTATKLLDAAIDSVRAQYYDNWELCICNDGSSAFHVRRALDAWTKKDSRIKVVHSPKNEGISSASNRALAVATGEFVGLLDHDDELSPNALYENVRLLQEHPEADMIYSDEDKLGPNGRRIDPFFKPDWSPEYMLSCMYTCHFGVYRKQLLENLGGFRKEFEGSQDYDLVLRVSEKTRNIFHLPKVLYHWRMAASSAAWSSHVKPYAFRAAKKAITEHLNRRGIPAQVLDGAWRGHYRLQFDVDRTAKISIIIPTHDKVELLSKCIRSIERKTKYSNYEILIVDNQSSDPDTLDYLSSSPHRVLSFPEPFSFSRIVNFAAQHATGNYLLFLNNDTEVISPRWVEEMLGYCQQKDIAVAGAKLLFPNDQIQHAGVILGIAGVAGHALKGFASDSRHHFGLSCNVRNYSAVTAACMMVRKDVFDELGGFDESLPIAYNDVDFCLRVRQAGYRIVCTPHAELYHVESASRGYPKNEREFIDMQRRWGKVLMNDPYYNPNLTLDREDFGLRMSGPFPA
jgi:GT2 family glycosyltransferase/SAM-dependent methyltransferase